MISRNSNHFKIRDLVDEIQLKAQVLIDEKTIIFFDEIQESPKLLKALRCFFYFSKEKKKTQAVKISLAPYSLKKTEHKISKEQVVIDLFEIPQYAIAHVDKILAR